MRGVVCLGEHQSYLFIDVNEGWRKVETHSPLTLKNFAFEMKSKRKPSLHQKSTLQQRRNKVGGNVHIFCNKHLFYNNLKTRC